MFPATDGSQHLCLTFLSISYFLHCGYESFTDRFITRFKVEGTFLIYCAALKSFTENLTYQGQVDCVMLR